MSMDLVTQARKEKARERERERERDRERERERDSVMRLYTCRQHKKVKNESILKPADVEKQPQAKRSVSSKTLIAFVLPEQ